MTCRPLPSGFIAAIAECSISCSPLGAGLICPVAWVNVSCLESGEKLEFESSGHLSITITKTPSSQTVALGGKATFHITVTNNGDVTLTNVNVSDPRSANCNRDLGTLAAGASQTYTCTRPNVRKKFVNTGEAVGTAQNGTVVRASATARVTVAAIQIVKGPNAQRPVNGVARFRITVTNIGDVRLRNVRVADPSTPGCNRRLGRLAAGASKTYSCTRPHVTKSFVNRAGVVGTAPNGRIRVTDVDAAAITITKKPVFTG